MPLRPLTPAQIVTRAVAAICETPGLPNETKLDLIQRVMDAVGADAAGTTDAEPDQ